MAPESPGPAGGNAAALAALAARVAACRRCPLAETRTQTVFGEGNPEAPLVLVGEGPGETEDATGRPFVGRAGALLDECMAANGITRKHVFICNVVKCRACVINGGRASNRPPAPAEVQACFPYLVEQLGIIRPLVILSIGAPSARALIDPSIAMLRQRGQWHEEGPYARRIAAALHPSFILRHGSGPEFERLRQLLIDDIGAARRKVIEVRKLPPVGQP